MENRAYQAFFPDKRVQISHFVMKVIDIQGEIYSTALEKFIYQEISPDIGHIFLTGNRVSVWYLPAHPMSKLYLQLSGEGFIFMALYPVTSLQ